MPVSLSGLLLDDPKAMRDHFRSSGVPAGPWAEVCNSFTSPCEREPGVAHVLVRRSQWARVPDQSAVTLTFVDRLGGSVSIPKLVPAASPTPLPREHRPKDTVLWLTLYDLRHRYRQVPVKRSYNLRLMSGRFDSGTLNGSDPWTWDGVVGDLWGRLRAAYPALRNGAGGTSAPAFPSPPTGTPESFSFWSTSAWDGLCAVAQAAGCVVRYDPVLDRVSILGVGGSAPLEPYGVVRERTWDTASFTGIPEAVPATFGLSFYRIGRADKHQEGAATGEGSSGTEVVLPAYPQAAGNPVSNGAYLAAFTARTLGLWRRDVAAAAEPRRVQYRGWQPWAQGAVGQGGYAAWSVSQLAADDVQTGLASGPLLVLPPGEFQPGMADGGSGSGSGGVSRLVGTVMTGLKCLGGVLWVIVRDHFEDELAFSSYGPARMAYTAGCCECPGTSGSGTGSGTGSGSGGGTGGTATCCGRALNATLTATLGGGEGSMALGWNGTHWIGSKLLGCGETLHLRLSTGCALEFSCDGTTWSTPFFTEPVRDCGPPYSDVTGYNCDMSPTFGGCAAGLCGTVTVVSVSE